MEKEKKISEEEENIEEPIELVLFQVSECYVYLRDGFLKQFADIPPRKSAASYRADEWNVNKWAWEGVLKVISKGEECIIRLEDKTTGELYARSFLREGEPHPVEAVIDSSRYFVLRIEENIGGRLRHAFIGIGFRERTEAYDFQAALHDHMKFLSVIMNDIVSERNELNLYLNKKKAAEEMEQQYQKSSSTDYSLKEGETIVLQLKNKSGSGGSRSKFFDQGLNNLSLEEKSNKSAGVVSIRPPPPPGGSLSPVISPKMPPSELPSKLNLENTAKEEPRESAAPEKESEKDIIDDDFGDFQTAV